MTYIGTPCIFYGDEVGLKGGGDPACRPSMEWDMGRQDRELYDFYRLMIGLRNEYMALRQGQFRFPKADAGDPRIVYERMRDGMHFTIWMNNANEPSVITHPMKADDWIDALSGETVKTEDGELRISLNAYGYRILKREIRPVE